MNHSKNQLVRVQTVLSTLALETSVTTLAVTVTVRPHSYVQYLLRYLIIVVILIYINLLSRTCGPYGEERA